jgi:hypothetical protein
MSKVGNSQLGRPTRKAFAITGTPPAEDKDSGPLNSAPLMLSKDNT